MVDAEGFISLPILGKLKVMGMSVNQVKEMIDEKLKEYVKDPSVSVKLVNYRVTVMGEVFRPGVQYVFEEKWTLFQALSNAGNPTDFADIKRVKLVREEEGQIKTVYLDLSRPELISSEYMFMQPHDMIYIEPVKAKTFATNSRVASVTLSTLSIILVLTNIILNNTR
jgi:polysaccharide export outer membrane protein